MNETNAVATRDKPMEFIPFGNTDRIKLTIDIVKSMCAVPTKSGKVCSDREAIKFMMLASARKLNPFESDCFLVGYETNGVAQFSMITAEQAFLKRAELNPDYDGIESGVIVQNEDGAIEELQGEFTLDTQKCVGGWARLKVKNRAVPFYERLAVRQYVKPGPFWEKNPQHQIAKCARVAVLRRAFPTSLGGLYLQEETDTAPMKRADAFEIQPGKLVDVQVSPPAQRTNGPEREPDDLNYRDATAPTLKPSGASRVELCGMVEGAGFTFDQFRAFAGEGELIKDADSLAGWDDIPEADAKRIVRAKAGLLAALTKLHGEPGAATERQML